MPPSPGTDALGALRKRLAGRDPPRVVAAVGPESFLREAALRAVAEAVLGSADSPDLVTLRVDQAAEGGAVGALERFFAEARTGSLFGGAKVVALRDAERAAAADAKAFLAWLKSPSPSVTVVLLAEELKQDHAAAARDAGVVVECGGRRGPATDPARFVADRAAERGKRIGRDEAGEVVRLVGDDLGALENAAEVLCLHAGDDEVLTATSIRALFPGAREGDSEEFCHAALSGDVATALAAAARCFSEGVPEGWNSRRIVRDERGVAGVLVRDLIRTLGQQAEAQGQLDAGVPPGEVRIGKLPPFICQKILRGLPRRRAGALDSLVLLLEDTDRGMKSGGAHGRVAIARLATAAGRYA